MGFTACVSFEYSFLGLSVTCEGVTSLDMVGVSIVYDVFQLTSRKVNRELIAGRFKLAHPNPCNCWNTFRIQFYRFQREQRDGMSTYASGQRYVIQT